jgi:hypothetical protein
VVVYRGNYYCVPMGTYSSCKKVLMSKDEESGQLEFYTSDEFKFLCKHDEVIGKKGVYCPLEVPSHPDPDKNRAAIAAEKRLYDAIYPYLDWGPFSRDWERIKKAVLNGKPRYYRGALDRLTRAIKEFGGIDIYSTILGILENDLKGINDILNFISECEMPDIPEPEIPLPDGMSEADITPDRSSVSDYRHLFEEDDLLPD